MKNQIWLVIFVSVIFIALQMLSDILSLRIINIAGLSIDGGTIVYPLVFTVRDLFHKIAGKNNSRFIVVLAAFVNIFMVALFWLIASLPADLSIGEQREFGLVLLPSWRIVIASIIAEIVAGLLDGETYSLWEKRFHNRKLWGRVLFSNLVSIPTDSAIFVFVAFLGTMPASIVFSILLSNIIVKFLIGTISLPIIYATKT